MNKIYSTPTCKFCKNAKEWMDQNGIAYTEINVAADLAERKEMIEKSGQMGVPVTITENGTVIVGFHADKFREAFGK